MPCVPTASKGLLNFFDISFYYNSLTLLVLGALAIMTLAAASAATLSVASFFFFATGSCRKNGTLGGTSKKLWVPICYEKYIGARESKHLSFCLFCMVAISSTYNHCRPWPEFEFWPLLSVFPFEDSHNVVFPFTMRGICVTAGTCSEQQDYKYTITHTTDQTDTYFTKQWLTRPFQGCFTGFCYMRISPQR